MKKKTQPSSGFHDHTNRETKIRKTDLHKNLVVCFDFSQQVSVDELSRIGDNFVGEGVDVRFPVHEHVCGVSQEATQQLLQARERGRCHVTVVEKKPLWLVVAVVVAS